jgi:hypothetical protein
MNNETRLFIARCVLEGVVFPPSRIGLPSLSIQDICRMSTSQLGAYLDKLEKSDVNKLSRTERAEGKTEPLITGTTIPYSEGFSFLEEIFKHSIQKDREIEKRAKLAELDKALLRMENTSERRARLEAERNELLGIKPVEQETANTGVSEG